jgi:hypothetical protein
MKKSDNKKIQQAMRLFKNFTGDEAVSIDNVEHEVDNVVMAVGLCNGIMYETLREGVTEKYIHEFRKGSRPILACSSNGKNLYLINGSFQFTNRGIVDKKRG